MKEIILNVDGMMCEGCENRIKNILKTIKGVIDISAKYETGIVKVLAKDNVEEQNIKEKIEDIGFSVK